MFKGKPVVGLQEDLTLSRRVQLAVLAHIRHTHTRYDLLLRETSWENARRVVEPVCLDILVKWRGDEETGRDQLDEVLREIVVIDDSDDEGSDAESEDDGEQESAEDSANTGDAMEGVVPTITREVVGKSIADPATPAEVPATSLLSREVVLGDEVILTHTRKAQAVEQSSLTETASKPTSQPQSKRTKKKKKKQSKSARRMRKMREAYDAAVKRRQEHIQHGSQGPPTPNDLADSRTMGPHGNGSPYASHHNRDVLDPAAYSTIPADHNYQAIYAIDDDYHRRRRMVVNADLPRLIRTTDVSRAPPGSGHERRDIGEHRAAPTPYNLRPRIDADLLYRVAAPGRSYASSRVENASRDSVLPSVESPKDLPSTARGNRFPENERPQVMYQVSREEGRPPAPRSVPHNHGSWEYESEGRRVIVVDDSYVPLAEKSGAGYVRLLPPQPSVQRPHSRGPLLPLVENRGFMEDRNGRREVRDDQLHDYRYIRHRGDVEGRDPWGYETRPQQYLSTHQGDRRIIFIDDDDSPVRQRALVRIPDPTSRQPRQEYISEERGARFQRAETQPDYESARPRVPGYAPIPGDRRPVESSRPSRHFPPELSAQRHAVEAKGSTDSSAFPTRPSHDMNSVRISYPQSSRPEYDSNFSSNNESLLEQRPLAYKRPGGRPMEEGTSEYA